MYSEKFQASIKLVEASREKNIALEPTRMTAKQKEDVLASFHPDYKKDEFEALKTITINPAKHLGIDNCVGSIEIGKDADIVICNGCPMNITVKPEAVFLNGKRVV